MLIPISELKNYVCFVDHSFVILFAVFFGPTVAKFGDLTIEKSYDQFSFRNMIPNFSKIADHQMIVQYILSIVQDRTFSEH